MDERLEQMAESLIREAATQCRRDPSLQNIHSMLMKLEQLDSPLSQWMSDAYSEARVIIRREMRKPA